jgi:hypothetical protein
MRIGAEGDPNTGLIALIYTTDDGRMLKSKLLTPDEAETLGQQLIEDAALAQTEGRSTVDAELLRKYFNET